MPAATAKMSQRPLAVTTPLGPDVLTLVSLSGQESLSRLFEYHLELSASNDKTIPFDQLLGQLVTVKITLNGADRYINGICRRVSQGESDDLYTSYSMEIVPQFWLWTKKAQSRIFQQLSVPDILNKVLEGLTIDVQLQGTYEPRDYCVQYRETDFNFACRLMEEEGIYFYFKHEDGKHTLVLGDAPQAHVDIPKQSKPTFKYTAGGESGAYVTQWEKAQELRSGKYTLRDHCFELPDSDLEAKQSIMGSVAVGGVSHNLAAGNNSALELYDFPGEYAQRFDGVNPAGGDQAADLQKIFNDNTRTVDIRMQEEALGALVVHGAGNCQQFAPGYKFTLQTIAGTPEAQAKADGAYVVTSVNHSGRQASLGLSGGDPDFQYHNTFTCIPAALPYRPARVTPKPVVHGTQTAVVVGPAGDEIFTDKYGRIKVQFFWDRQGENNANSSCWVRVGTPWAGKQWGMIHIPRIGQEVIVAFEEGDPDQPIVVGSVYNADQMPPYTLPDNKTQSGLVTRSTLKGDPETFNELCFEDKKGEELVYLRAEKDLTYVAENDRVGYVGHDDWMEVHNDQTIILEEGNRQKTIKKGDETVEIKQGSRTETVQQDETITIKQGKRSITVETGDNVLDVKTGNRQVTVDTGNDSHQVKTGNRDVKIDMGNDSLTISMGNQTTKLDLGASSTEAMQSITLKVGQSKVTIDQTGVTIEGMMVKINGQVQTQVQGAMTQVSGSAMLQLSGAITMIG